MFVGKRGADPRRPVLVVRRGSGWLAGDSIDRPSCGTKDLGLLWNTQGRSDGEGRIDVVFPPEVICGKLKGAKEVNKRTLEWRACIIDRTELEQTTDYYAPTPPSSSSSYHLLHLLLLASFLFFSRSRPTTIDDVKAKRSESSWWSNWDWD